MSDIEVVEGDPDREQLFTSFRERVFAAIDNSLGHYTVPLVVEDGERLVEFRSGVLLQIADMQFLVTAGHRLIDYTTQGHRIGIALPVKGTHPILLVEEEFWTTKDDREDITVTQLTPPVVAYLEDHYRYVRLPAVMSRSDTSQRRGLYVLYGYPEALLGKDETDTRRLRDWRYLTTPFDGDFGVVENYDPQLHLVVTYERNTYSREGEQVLPHGMSGCGIWFVGTPLTHPLFTQEDFRLVAIQNSWHRKHQYAKGTWIDDVLLILWKYYSNTHGPLRLAGFDFDRCPSVLRPT
jgi:hypothetical protein